MNTNSQGNTQHTVAQGTNSKTIVVHTSNGTIVKPNPNYKPAPKGILASIFGK